jgi:hypothetical protein
MMAASAKQQKTWKSMVYVHFNTPNIIRDGDEVTYEFHCKKLHFLLLPTSLMHAYSNHRSPSVVVTRARHDDSTSNLMRHVRWCDHTAEPGSGSITVFAQGSTYTPHKHRMKIALWVARRHRPFSIVEDPELLDIFTDLNNKAVTPSRYTVSRDVKEIFQLSRKKVSELLKVIALHWTINLANARFSSRDILESCICVQTDGRLPMS